jgi:hypothetical protein
VKTFHTVPPGFHQCPGVCDDRVVPDSIYACVDCWLTLPQRAKAWISSTARLSTLHPQRRAAIEFARRSWNEWLIRKNSV